MKKEYTKPELLLSIFSTEDIITSSSISGSEDTDTPSTDESSEMSLKNYPVEQNLDDII